MFFVPIKLPHKVHYRLDLNFWLGIQIKVVYFEKAIKFCEISTLLLSTVHSNKSKEEISQNFVAFSKYMNFNSQIYGGDFAKFCGLLKTYEL